MSAPNGQVKKPSIVSQLAPFLVAAAVLAYVFWGLSGNVIDERHSLSGQEWSSLAKRGVKTGTLEVRSPEGELYCGPDSELDGCPAGGDFEVRPEPAAIRRGPNSRIPDGGTALASYVHKVRPSDVWAIIKGADLRLFLPLMILHILMFFVGDVYSFGLAYRMFNTPDISTREMFECRAAPYVIQVAVAPLAEILFPLYMLRVKKARVTEIVSSNLWSMIMDASAMLTAITPAVIYNVFVDTKVPAIGYGWLAACVVFWTLFLGNIIFWHSPAQDRARAWVKTGEGGEGAGVKAKAGSALSLLRTFSIARWHHYLKVYGVRMCILCTNLASNYAALRALGIDPDPAIAFIGIPIVVFSIFLPIGVGGYGGPQLIAWFLFVELGKAGTADQVIAYSLMWSTFFLAGRALIGLVFIRGFWRRCFPDGFNLG